MDNNFYNILQTFKRLDEGMTKEAMWHDAERMTREQFCEKWGDEHGEFWDAIMGEIDEGSMADAEHHPKGPKFGGYWKGADKNPPKPGQGVGGCEESRDLSLEEELINEWDQFLKEFGGNNPTTGIGSNPVDAKAMAVKTQNTTNFMQKLGNQVGIKPGVGAGQAAATIVKNVGNPNINPTTGQGMDSTGKKVTGALGKGIEDIVAGANPADANKLAQDLTHMKLKQAGQK